MSKKAIRERALATQMVHGEALERARRLLTTTDSILVLTGAGISAESDIPVFRAEDGLWASRDPYEVATAEGFRRDPLDVWRFYASRIERHRGARPNAGHVALAALEEWATQRGTDFLLATQNVDGLHARAGSRNLVELHGTIARVRCEACEAERETFTLDLSRLPPLCACGHPLRPDVVWFGEPLPEQYIARSMEHAGHGGVCLVVGDPSLVHPAAALPLLTLEAGGAVIQVNPERTSLTPRAQVVLPGPAAATLPGLVEGLR